MYRKNSGIGNFVNQRAKTSYRVLGACLVTLGLMIFSGCASQSASTAMASEPLPWSQRPPTVDPTYGLPIPANQSQARVIPYWIWTARTYKNQVLYLRRSFSLSAIPPKVTLYALASGRMALFLNGKEMADTFHKYHGTWTRACKLSIASFLHTGKNTIAIRSENYGGAAGVVVWVLAGPETLDISNSSWRIANRVPAGKGWTKTDFNDSAWTHAGLVGPYGGDSTSSRYAWRHLAHAAIAPTLGGRAWSTTITPWPPQAYYLAHLHFQPTRVEVLHGKNAFKGLADVAERLTPADIAEVRPDYQGRSLLAPAHGVDIVVTPSASNSHPELLLSFGQEVTGRIQVRGTGGAVSIGTGESRGEALHKPWGGIHKLNLVAGKMESTPYSAFRYATVTFSGAGPMDLHTLRLDFKYYPVKYRGAFACSNPLLTKIWYTGAYTAHLCMQEQVWDAPKRDRAMWMGDLQVSGQVINNVFLNRFLMELTLRGLRVEAQGGRPATALPVTDVNNIPGYSNAWICGLADFYRHTGAIGYLRSQHQLLLSMLRYIRQAFNRKNIFSNKHHKWCFVDWAPKLSGGTPQAELATDLYTCLAVRRAVSLLNALGDKTNAQKYARWERELIRSARHYLVDHKTDTYTSLRQVNAMAIDAHVADAQQREAIYKQILGPRCPSWKQMATPYYNNFVLFAIGHLGHTNQGLKFAEKYWGGMIREGATTFWEAYDNSWPKKHFHRFLKADNGEGYFVSLCHGWSSGVTSWLTEYVLGVQPRTGGFARTMIVPHLGNLSWASGRVPTPHGDIVISVKANIHADSIRLTLPAGVDTLVGVLGRSVTVNGQTVTPVRRSTKRCYINLNHAGVFHIHGHA